MAEYEPNFKVFDPDRLIKNLNGILLGMYDLGLDDWEGKWPMAVNFWEAMHRRDLFYRFGSSILQNISGDGFLPAGSDRVVGGVVVEGGYSRKDETEYENLALVLRREFFLRGSDGSIPRCKVEISVDLPDSGL